jgi:hypothetical protein
MEQLISVGIFNSEFDNNDETVSQTHKKRTKELNQPPKYGARLGMDQEGNPAWFIKDENKVGEYVQIDL